MSAFNNFGSGVPPGGGNNHPVFSSSLTAQQAPVLGGRGVARGGRGRGDSGARGRGRGHPQGPEGLQSQQQQRHFQQQHGGSGPHSHAVQNPGILPTPFSRDGGAILGSGGNRSSNNFSSGQISMTTGFVPLPPPPVLGEAVPMSTRSAPPVYMASQGSVFPVSSASSLSHQTSFQASPPPPVQGGTFGISSGAAPPGQTSFKAALSGSSGSVFASSSSTATPVAAPPPRPQPKMPESAAAAVALAPPPMPFSATAKFGSVFGNVAPPTSRPPALTSSTSDSTSSVFGSSTAAAAAHSTLAPAQSHSSVFGNIIAANTTTKTTSTTVPLPSSSTSFPPAAVAPEPAAAAMPKSVFGAAAAAAAATEPNRKRPFESTSGAASMLSMPVSQKQQTHTGDGYDEEAAIKRREARFKEGVDSGSSGPVAAPFESAFPSSFSSSSPPPSSLPLGLQRESSSAAPVNSSSGLSTPMVGSPTSYGSGFQHTSSTITTTSGSAVPLQVRRTEPSCMVARFFVPFARSIASADAVEHEDCSARILEDVCFGKVGRIGLKPDFRHTVSEMLGVWENIKSSNHSVLSGVAGELWVALVALAAQLNCLTSSLQAADGIITTDPRQLKEIQDEIAAARRSDAELARYVDGIVTNRDEALADACDYANQLNDLLLELYSHVDVMRTPMSILPIILRRVRITYDEASARQMTRVQPNTRTVSAKIFAQLNKRLKTSGAMSKLESPLAPWRLVPTSYEHKRLILSFARLLSEMFQCEAASNPDMARFMDAFHRDFSWAREERCLLYYGRANLLIQQPLAMEDMTEAAQLLARAMLTCPENAPACNRRIIFIKITAVCFAQGMLPNPAELTKYDVPQLADIFVAIRASNLMLFDIALRNNAAYFIEAGIYNVLQLVRERIALLMVVKYYIAKGCDRRLHVQEMVAFFDLPFTVLEAKTVWLLPLLVKMRINGVLDSDWLLLSDANPFGDYPKEKLVAAYQVEYEAAS